MSTVMNSSGSIAGLYRDFRCYFHLFPGFAHNLQSLTVPLTLIAIPG